VGDYNTGEEEEIMRTRFYAHVVSGLTLSALLAAGISAQEAPPADNAAPAAHNNLRKAIRWKHFEYSCAGGAKLAVDLGDHLAKVSFGGQAYLMKQTMSADGNRYSDGKVVWWGKGNGGFLQEDKPDGNGEMIVTECKLVEEPPAAAGVLSGTVTYLQRVALPSSALLDVKLQDISRADAAATVVAEQKITAGGRQMPIAFELKFDPAKMDAKHRYTVSARITVDGGLRFVSDQAYPLVTQGSPTTGVEVLVKAVPAN
jgi:uncharacterized lipoprotein YbaY